MTYLAKCPGPCSQAVPQQLTWVKFQEAARIEAGPIPGLWGSDLLTRAGSTITMNLPQGLESGEYVSVYPSLVNSGRVSNTRICPADYEARDLGSAQCPKRRASSMFFVITYIPIYHTDTPPPVLPHVHQPPHYRRWQLPSPRGPRHQNPRWHPCR